MIFEKKKKQEHYRRATSNWNVDAVLRLLGVFHDFLYGDTSNCHPRPVYKL